MKPTKFFWTCLGIALILLVVIIGVNTLFQNDKVKITLPGGGGLEMNLSPSMPSIVPKDAK